MGEVGQSEKNGTAGRETTCCVHGTESGGLAGRSRVNQVAVGGRLVRR